MTPSSSNKALALGGAINPRKQIYIDRIDVEGAIYDSLEQGEYCNILCARQVGKTSLTYKIAMRLEQSGHRVVLIDVSSIGSPSDANVWFRDVLMQVSKQLQLDFSFHEWWKREDGSPGTRLVSFFKDWVFESSDLPVTVFVDEIDSTLKLDYTDDFFTAIRSIYNQRSTISQFEKVSFCLIGVATPNELIKDRRTTSYNVGRSFELRDFDPKKDDLSSLEQLLAKISSKPAQFLEEIIHYTNGHPYLTVLLCQEFVSTNEKNPSVGMLVRNRFGSISELKTDVHFEQILRFLDKRVSRVDDTLDIYGGLLKGRNVEATSALPHIELRLAGLVKCLEGRLQIRNRIYEQVFDWNWLQSLRPSRTRRQLKIIAASSLACIFVLCLILFNTLVLPYFRNLSFLNVLSNMEVREAIAEVDKRIGLPIDDSHENVRALLKQQISREIEESASSSLLTNVSQIRSLVRKDPSLVEFIDAEISKDSVSILSQEDWEAEMLKLSQLILSVENMPLKAGLVGMLQSRTEERLKTFAIGEQALSLQNRSALQKLLTQLEKNFQYEEFQSYLKKRNADLQGVLAQELENTLAEALDEKLELKVGKAFVLSGQISPPQNETTNSKFVVSLGSPSSNRKSIEFSIQKLNSLNGTNLYYQIRTAAHANSPLSVQTDGIVVTDEQPISLSISRKRHWISFSLNRKEIRCAFLFDGFDSSQTLKCDGDASWGLDLSSTKLRYSLPSAVPTEMDIADESFRVKEYRTATERYKQIVETTLSPVLQNEARLKYVVCLSNLGQGANSALAQQGLLEKQTQLSDLWNEFIFEDENVNKHNEFAIYAIYMRLVETLERHGFFWDTPDQVQALALVQRLRTLASEETPNYVPNELWETMHQAIGGRASNSIERLKFTEDDAERYRILLELSGSAPLSLKGELLSHATNANLYVEDYTAAHKLATEYLDGVYVRSSADGLVGSADHLSIALRLYAWSTTLVDLETNGDHDQIRYVEEALAKISELKKQIPGQGLEFDLESARLQLASREPRLQVCAEILDRLLESKNLSQQESFIVCEAYLLRGLVHRKNGQSESAAETWKKGFQFAERNKIPESDISFILLGSLSHSLNEASVQESFERNLKQGAFAAGGMLLGMLKSQMQEVYAAVADMYYLPPGDEESSKLILRQVSAGEYLVLQADLGMLQTIRRGAFKRDGTIPEDPDRDALIRIMSRNGLNAFRRKELAETSMVSILVAWLNPRSYAKKEEQLPKSVAHELSYILGHKILNSSRPDSKDARQLLKYAAKSKRELTRRLAERSLQALDESLANEQAKE